MIGCFFTLFITALLVFFMTCSQFPGTAQLQSSSLLPLSNGFANAFHISVLQSSWFCLPAIYGTSLGFLWICGRQFTALGKSGLLLPVISNYMKLTDLLGEPKNNSFSSSSSASVSSASTVGLLIGTVCSLILVVIIHFGFHNNITILADICFLGAYFQYLLLLWSYLTMKKKYTLLERHFLSPLGNVGAVLGIVLFSVGVISIVVFRTRVNYAVEGFLGIMVVLVLCYIGLIQKHQTFSMDEQKNMFSAYLINGKRISFSLPLSFYFFFVNCFDFLPFIANTRSRKANATPRKNKYNSGRAVVGGGAGGLAPSSKTSKRSTSETGESFIFTSPGIQLNKTISSKSQQDNIHHHLHPRGLIPDLELNAIDGSLRTMSVSYNQQTPLTILPQHAEEEGPLENDKEISESSQQEINNKSKSTKKIELGTNNGNRVPFSTNSQKFNAFFQKIDPNDDDEDDEEEGDDEDEEEEDEPFESPSILRSLSTDIARTAMKLIFPSSLSVKTFASNNNRVLASVDEFDEMEGHGPRLLYSSSKNGGLPPRCPSLQAVSVDESIAFSHDYHLQNHPKTTTMMMKGILLLSHNNENGSNNGSNSSLPSTGRKKVHSPFGTGENAFSFDNLRPSSNNQSGNVSQTNSLTRESPQQNSLSSSPVVPHTTTTNLISASERIAASNNITAVLTNLKSASEGLVLLGGAGGSNSNPNIHNLVIDTELGGGLSSPLKLKRKRKNSQRKQQQADPFANHFLETVFQNQSLPSDFVAETILKSQEMFEEEEKKKNQLILEQQQEQQKSKKHVQRRRSSHHNNNNNGLSSSLISRAASLDIFHVFSKSLSRSRSDDRQDNNNHNNNNNNNNSARNSNNNSGNNSGNNSHRSRKSNNSKNGDDDDDEEERETRERCIRISSDEQDSRSVFSNSSVLSGNSVSRDTKSNTEKNCTNNHHYHFHHRDELDEEEEGKESTHTEENSLTFRNNQYFDERTADDPADDDRNKKDQHQQTAPKHEETSFKQIGTSLFL
jgi:hypothetical protein